MCCAEYALVFKHYQGQISISILCIHGKNDTNSTYLAGLHMSCLANVKPSQICLHMKPPFC